MLFRSSLPLSSSRLGPSSFSVCGTFSKRLFVISARFSNHQTTPDPPCQFVSKFIVSITSDYLVNTPRHPLAHPRVTGPPAPTCSHRRFDPAKYYLGGWIDGSTGTERWAPTSRGQDEEVKSKLLVMRPCIDLQSQSKTLQGDRSRKRIYMMGQPSANSAEFGLSMSRLYSMWLRGASSPGNSRFHSAFHLWKRIVLAAARDQLIAQNFCSLPTSLPRFPESRGNACPPTVDTQPRVLFSPSFSLGLPGCLA